MHNKTHKPHPALAEVHRAAHSQDLVEVSKRAALQRKSENHEIHLPRTKHGEDRIEVGL